MPPGTLDVSPHIAMGARTDFKASSPFVSMYKVYASCKNHPTFHQQLPLLFLSKAGVWLPIKRATTHHSPHPAKRSRSRLLGMPAKARADKATRENIPRIDSSHGLCTLMLCFNPQRAKSVPIKLAKSFFRAMS